MLTIFSLSYCPWCKEAKVWFDDHKVPYQVVEVDTLPPGTYRSTLEDVLPGYPLVINRNAGKFIAGFRPEWYPALIKDIPCEGCRQLENLTVPAP